MTQSVMYKGHKYKLLWRGLTEWGVERCKLGFWDGSKEFFCDAELVTDGPDTEARNASLVAVDKATQKAIASSRAADADIDVPAPSGLTYLPFQKAGIAYAVKRRDTLFGDEMGLGKTIETAGFINATSSITSVLLIVPASLKENWRRELSKWLVRLIRVTILKDVFPANGIVITNYEQIIKWRKEIDAREWHLLVCDESHYLKNPEAQRTRAVLGHWSREEAERLAPIKAKRRLFLTGTAILNRPAELWTVCRAFDPWGLGRTWEDYHRRYCNGYEGDYGWNTGGASHLGELQERLRAKFMIRRLKSEVLTELPAKRRQILVLNAESEEARKALENEAEAMAKREAKIKKLRDELLTLSEDKAKEAYQEAASKLRLAESTFTLFTEMSAVRHEVALAKVPQVLEHIKQCLESETKLLVYAHHLDVIDLLVEGLEDYGVVKMDGRDPLPKRDEVVKTFQEDPKCRVAVGGMHVMGFGHNMTAASHVVFSELDWTPATLEQCEDRCHRIGQKDSVFVQHIVLNESLDAKMAQLIVEKMEIISATLDDRPAENT